MFKWDSVKSLFKRINFCMLKCVRTKIKLCNETCLTMYDKYPNKNNQRSQDDKKNNPERPSQRWTQLPCLNGALKLA